MLILIGAAVVFAATIGGFMYAGGHPGVLLHLSEFIVILGIAAGVLIIATPMHVIKEIIHKVQGAMFGKTPGKAEFFDILKLLYELFMTGRRNGLIALEEHVMDPTQSALFKRYPSVLNHPERRKFIVNGLKPVIDGKIKPDQLEDLMAAELKAKEIEMEHPVHAMQMIGDSLPAIGIVAAVLGIINTMSAIAEGPEVVGEKVAAALTGTMLGIFCAYGFVNPIAGRVRSNNASDMLCFNCIMHAVAGFAKGLAPLTAIEVARRSLDSAVQPGAEELEAAVKGLGTGK
ncbi:flagellar motor stator protein MotA [Oleiharenicola lentus]|uniref:Flagellar motor stator protein MotA n=1 Tax=Oleiharenicola lentus TaxID=2508720 RepID=A0A4Q1C3N4_9BACT|nr:motility-associated protein [Oleiharenicola lentus]RXK52950.1 flagellar motor stator protein MotA [Oleiharenicola lentus]